MENQFGELFQEDVDQVLVASSGGRVFDAGLLSFLLLGKILINKIKKYRYLFCIQSIFGLRKGSSIQNIKVVLK